MTGKLSTHVLDIANGTPAQGVRIDLLRGSGPGATPIKTVHTNADGRTDAALLENGALATGAYTLVFHVGAYFRAKGTAGAGAFLDQVPVMFSVADASAKYHVPLLVSPWAYSTYRGS